MAGSSHIHEVAGDGVTGRGTEQFSRNDNGIVTTSSSYDPNASDAPAILARELLGYAYYDAYKDTGQWNIPGEAGVTDENESFSNDYKNADGGCCQNPTSREATARLAESNARNGLNLNNPDPFNGEKADRSNFILDNETKEKYLIFKKEDPAKANSAEEEGEREGGSKRPLCNPADPYHDIFGKPLC